MGLGIATQKISIDCWNGLIEKTPVDTGRARAAWAMGLGELPEQEPPPKATKPGASDEDPPPMVRLVILPSMISMEPWK